MKENVNVSEDLVDVKVVEPISDIIFKKLNRLEEMMNKLVSDQIVMRITSDEDVKEAVSAALMNHHHLFASKLEENTMDQIAKDVLDRLKQ